MKETIRGICKMQGKEYSVQIKKIPCDTFEDRNSKYEYGTITCDYIASGGECDGKCSIAIQNGIKR